MSFNEKKEHRFGGHYDFTIVEPLRNSVSWRCDKFGFMVRMCRVPSCLNYQKCKIKISGDE